MELLEKEPAVLHAARVGDTFKIDPVVYLRSSPFENAVRVAAHNLIQDDYRKARERAQADK